MAASGMLAPGWSSSPAPRARRPAPGVRLLFTVFLLCTRAAQAQSALPLFLETARDPGRADLAVTARVLGMAGVRTPSGAADSLDAPAGLRHGPGLEVVLSAGLARLSPEELILTPKQMPPYDSRRAALPSSSSPSGFAAVARRHAPWAVAAFADTTDRARFEFATARSPLNVSAIPGIIITQEGTGTGAFTRAGTRVGGAVAVGSRGGRVTVGGALYALRLSFDVRAAVETTTVAVFYPPYTPSRVESTSVDTTGVHDAVWGLGTTASVLVVPVRHVTVGARWRHEPALEFVRMVSLGSGEPAPRQSVQFDPPDVLGISASWSNATAVIGGEVVWLAYRGTYTPFTPPTSSSDPCQTLSTSLCPGWGFGSYRDSNARSWRTGAELRLPVSAGRWLARAGFAFDDGYTVARSSADPDINAGQSPAPVLTTPFVPPREDVRTIAAGGGFAWSRVELSAGIAHTSSGRRVLVDLRWSGR